MKINVLAQYILIVVGVIAVVWGLTRTNPVYGLFLSHFSGSVSLENLIEKLVVSFSPMLLPVVLGALLVHFAKKLAVSIWDVNRYSKPISAISPREVILLTAYGCAPLLFIHALVYIISWSMSLLQAGPSSQVMLSVFICVAAFKMIVGLVLFLLPKFYKF